jgi:hypothetical protein
LSLLLLGHVTIFSQGKTLQATKINQGPVIDGLLNDAAWQGVIPATGFIQNFPNVGTPASQRTEVKIVYDDEAIYVGAYLYDDSAMIRRQITARDEEQQKDLDYFSVFFDTYKDQQNGFQFLVTSSNVQTDARLAPNITTGFGEYGDKTWDAVWESKVMIRSDGWVVEMKIPYLSLRFSKSDTQNWGLQFLRSVRRNNETTFWNFVDPQVNGFVNQFGVLLDLHEIQPPLRLSFSPYLSTGIRNTPERDGYRSEWLKSGGMDVKYGINESFTLDATLIPDFGQVISDNVINNLTPYEVRFDDYRPFFTEGTEIFNKSGLFYSRRIGAAPTGYHDVNDLVAGNQDLEVVKNPGRTQLYNAIKVSGRTKNKLGIGILNAIGAPMHAVVRDKTTGDETEIKTESLTNYNILVLDQALRGRSYVTFTNTNVLRDGHGRDANVSGLDLSLYDKNNNYNFRGYAHYSKIFGPGSYDGFNTMVRAGKVSGHIRYFAQNIIRSVNYDPTDLGYLQTPNQVINMGSISYNQFNPTKHFLNQTYSLSVTQSSLFKPGNFTDLTIEASAFWYFKNFWDVTLRASYLPDQHDYFILGREVDQYARRPQYGAFGLSGSTDSRKRLFFNYDVLVAKFFKNPEKKYYVIEGGLRYRFSNKLTMELSHRYETETDYIISAGRDGMNRPRIAFVDLKDVSSVLSGIYNFTPRINLTLRMRHYWSNVDIKRVAHVDGTGLPVNQVAYTGVDNVNYFNADAFLTWDFQYGSRLILGYKNWLGTDEIVDGMRYKRYIPNLGQSLSLRHGNELTVRFIYFLDYNKLRK